MPQDKFLGSIPGRALGNIRVICSFCPHAVAMSSCQPLTEMSNKEFPWGVKCDWHVEQTVLPNVKVKMEAQHVGSFHSTCRSSWFLLYYCNSNVIMCICWLKL